MKIIIDISEGILEKQASQSSDKVVEKKYENRSGLAKVEPRMYEMFLNMNPYDFSKFMKDWISQHMDDHELTNGQVERMFKTPMGMYQRRWS